MSFRDLGCFNDALLAKQLWRLITQPNLLVVKLFKERYFPDGFNPCKVAFRGASPMWRGFLGASNIIAKGSRMAIGNGENVGIWTDAWIPRPHSFKPITSPRPVAIAMVVDLIDKERSCWNIDKLAVCFNAVDIPEILSIPLALNNIPDMAL